MSGLGVHPRLAHMILRGARLGHLTLAVRIAALLSERDLLRGVAHERDPDLRVRLDALSDTGPRTAAFDAQAVQRVRQAVTSDHAACARRAVARPRVAPGARRRRCDGAAARVRVPRPHRAVAGRPRRPVPVERRSRRPAARFRGVWRAASSSSPRRSTRAPPTPAFNSQHRCVARSSTSTSAPRSRMSRSSRGTRARQPCSRSASGGSARCVSRSRRCAHRPPTPSRVR